MTGDLPPPDESDLERLAEDWITLWQSELAALAADREAAEAWAAASSAWAALGAAWLRMAATPPFGRPPPAWPVDRPPPAQPFPPGGVPAAPAGHDGAAPPPRPAPAAAAPDDGRGPGMAGDGGDAARLARRLAELERRLADVEGGKRGGGADRRAPRRRKPPA